MTQNTRYALVLAGDTSGDGMADALLRRDDGRWLLYAIDGSGPSVLAQDSPPMKTSTDWVLQDE